MVSIVTDAPTRERIALALAQQNGCEYCVSAHTAIGRKAGLNADEIAAARARAPTPGPPPQSSSPGA